MGHQADRTTPPPNRDGGFAFRPSGRVPLRPPGILPKHRFPKAKRHHEKPRAGFVVLAAATMALALAAGAFVVLRPEPAGAALSLGFQQGETEQYRLTASLDSSIELGPNQVSAIQSSMSETVAMRVVSIDPRGNAKLDLRIMDVSGQVDGQPIKRPEQKHFRLLVAQDGRIVETAAGLAYVSLDGEPGNAQIFPLLPDHPVNPGDRWEVENRQKLPRSIGRLSLHSWNELLGYEEVGGVRAALVDSVISGTMEADFDHTELGRIMHASDIPAGVEASSFGQVWVKQSVWLDAATGDILRGDGSVKFELTMRVTGGPAGDFRGHFNGQMELQLERL